MRVNGKTAPPGSRGFTLLEVLIAMVTVAIGLAGNYLMFARSMQQQQHGTYQSRAVVIARGVAADLGAGRVASLASPASCHAGDALACAAVARQAVVERRWQREVAAQLPTGALHIQRDASGQVTIAVTWQDALSVQPSGFRMTVTRP